MKIYSEAEAVLFFARRAFSVSNLRKFAWQFFKIFQPLLKLKRINKIALGMYDTIKSIYTIITQEISRYTKCPKIRQL